MLHITDGQMQMAATPMPTVERQANISLGLMVGLLNYKQLV